MGGTRDLSEDLEADRILDKMGRRMLKRRVDALKSLPTFPESVIRINQLIAQDDPDESFASIARVIETDPVLCARVLRLVNSAFYGSGGAIVTVYDALVMLGFDVVRGLVLSASVVDLNAEKGALDGLWEHSFGCAVAAGAIGRTLGLRGVQEISAAALMHDIGKIVLQSQLPDEYPTVVAHAVDRGVPIREAERAVLGVDHAEIGDWLCRRWRLPPPLAEPIALHHEPSQAKKHQQATCVVHIADILVRGYGFGFPGDQVVPDLDPRAWKVLQLNPDKLDQAARRFHTDLHESVANVNFLLPA